jgi:alkanesulfonate monooxygenase SsuD/methylene tetrahydromethanopterin reductase-like flavin-dependent oxidoreductase (luciferase family)
MINPAESKRSDDEVYQDELSLIDLVEPLGFDSLMCVEHHFTGFAMIPNNLQLLAYIAGRTKRIQLVTDVIVLPWREPIRVAEEIATLDVLCGGRTIFGFGRGAAPVEYDGFGVPMAKSRERFKEAAEIVLKGITQERFSYHGKHFNIPEIAIRPRPVSHPERRFYAASISPESLNNRRRSPQHWYSPHWPSGSATVSRMRLGTAPPLRRSSSHRCWSRARRDWENQSDKYPWFPYFCPA